MSGPYCKVLFLTIPESGAEDDDDFGQRVARHLPEGDAVHEFQPLGPSRYDDVLDRLQAGAVPVVLKGPRNRDDV